MRGENLTVLVVEPMKRPYAAQVPDRLEDLQALVGGDIEAVYPFDEPVALVCHSEGKLLGLSPNRVLTDEHGVPYDIVCGTFFLVGVGEENFISLTGEQLKRCQEKYSREMVFPLKDWPTRDKSRKKEKDSYER